MNNLSKQEVNIYKHNRKNIYGLVSNIVYYECWNLKQMGRVESYVDCKEKYIQTKIQGCALIQRVCN